MNFALNCVHIAIASGCAARFGGWKSGADLPVEVSPQPLSEQGARPPSGKKILDWPVM